MLFAYFAGHGCQDPRQVFILNEDNVDNAFWPVEYNLNRLMDLCGGALKVFCIFDCCREDKDKPEKTIRDFQAKQEEKPINQSQS